MAKLFIKKTVHIDSVDVKAINNKIKLTCPASMKEKLDLQKKQDRYSSLQGLAKQASFMDDNIIAKRLYTKFKQMLTPKHKKKLIIIEEEAKKNRSKTTKPIELTRSYDDNKLWYFKKNKNTNYKSTFHLEPISKQMEDTDWNIPKLIDESQRLTLNQWNVQNVMKKNNILKYDEYQTIIKNQENVMEKIKSEYKLIPIVDEKRFIKNINIRNEFIIEDEPTANNTILENENVGDGINDEIKSNVSDSNVNLPLICEKKKKSKKNVKGKR